MRMIDADTAKKAVHEELDECLVWDESGEHTANVIEEILEALPTVDAEPVRHGQWEYVDYGGFGNWHCSHCREICITNGDYDYCPNCGAKMDAERKEE